MRKRNLRTGYTTGMCASAAAKAAALTLRNQARPSSVEVQLPIGQSACLAVHCCDHGEGWARASVIKDAGDDPDITDGAEIVATVNWQEKPGIELQGGEGVGTVTKPGLGLAVGSAAINPVPRQMIHDSVAEALGEELTKRGVRVVISVPEGEALARKTLNPRLGIHGGISILGTTGLVIPYSTAAYRATVIQALGVAAACGCDHVVLTTGGRSERTAQQLLPHLPEEAFIQVGEFLGIALRKARKQGLRRATFCGMVGKFSKVAAGASQLHVKHSQVDLIFLAGLAAQCGASEELQERIRRANTARHASEIVREEGLAGWHEKLCERVHERCVEMVGDALEVECILVDFANNVLARMDHVR